MKLNEALKASGIASLILSAISLIILYSVIPITLGLVILLLVLWYYVALMVVILFDTLANRSIL
jgi:hypothetical protein